MLIEEIIRSCVHEEVAKAAVSCIGKTFASEVEKAAADYGMSTGAFVAMAVTCFARRGEEAELRAVQTAIANTQEPILVGLHRILSFMLAAGTGSTCDVPRQSVPGFVARNFDPVMAAPRHQYVY